jgi:hypothetical protein
MKQTKAHRWSAHVDYLKPDQITDNPPSEATMNGETLEVYAATEFDARQIVWRKYSIRGITSYTIKRIERVDGI